MSVVHECRKGEREKVAEFRSVGSWLVCACLAAALPSVCSWGAVDSARNSVLSSWLGAQSQLQSWEADFVQTRTLKTLTQPLTATGHLWFQAPNRFRWEVRKPAPTIALRTADELLVMYPKLQRVERFPLSGSQVGPWRDALALLEAGFPRSEADVQRQYTVLSQAVSNSVCRLVLQPRSAAARKMIPQLVIEFNTSTQSLLATELEFVDGSRMRNDFQNPKLNPKLEPELFEPSIPVGYKVIEPLAK
jgi:outer membrane lipoprotein-sorting protein